MAFQNYLDTITTLQSEIFNTYFTPHCIQQKNNKEENFHYQRLCTTLVRRFHQMEQQNEESNKISQEDFRIGSGHMLSGIRAHVLTNVVMATMASLLTLIDSRFLYSHKFSNIFVSHLQDHLDGKDSQFRVQTAKEKKSGAKERWSDQNANDVIYRPQQLKNI